MPEFNLPATEKQILFARRLAARNHALLPWDIQCDRRKLSTWIDQQLKQSAAISDLPSSKQVGYAERLARAKRRTVPEECFRSRELMTRWINSLAQ